MNWMIARTHVAPLNTICTMEDTCTKTNVFGWKTTKQNEKSSSWMVAAARYEWDGDGKLVSTSKPFT